MLELSNSTSLGLYNSVLPLAIKYLFFKFLKISGKNYCVAMGTLEVFPFILKVIVLFFLFPLPLSRITMFEFHRFHLILTLISYLLIAYEILDVIEISFVADQTGLYILVTKFPPPP